MIKPGSTVLITGTVLRERDGLLEIQVKNAGELLHMRPEADNLQLAEPRREKRATRVETETTSP